MTNKPEQTKPPAHKKGKVKKPKVKRVYRFGVIPILLLLLLTITMFLITPIYSVIFSYLPELYQRSIFENMYQSITLSEGTQELSKPRKYMPPESLPVLGENSGICFYFYSTIGHENKNFINAKRLDDAARGKKIAEIIAVDNYKIEYSLNITTMSETIDKDGNRISSVCQVFGNDYPGTPKSINALYVRPLRPFTPHKVTWVSIRTLYQVEFLK